MADLDRVLALARLPEVTLVTFGDLIRVPASRGTLAAERAAGADVRVVYSPRDAVRIAAEEPGRQVVFAGIGFETTAPTTAAALLEARAAGLTNFSLLSLHKTMPLPLRALLDLGETPISGFLLPGHVSVITGTALLRVPGRASTASPAWWPGSRRATCSRRCSCWCACLSREIAIQYTRAVRPEGNVVAQRLLEQVFEPSDADWRGLGVIPGSGLALREEFAGVDAGAPVRRSTRGPTLEPRGLPLRRGAARRHRPGRLPLCSAARCTPEDPVGACMVSSEGACAARYRYRGLDDA